jgi:hypothetical protein
MPAKQRTRPRVTVAVRDTAHLAQVVEASGLSREELSAATLAWQILKPGNYLSCNYQTIQKLVSGKQLRLNSFRASALERVLKVEEGQLFDYEPAPAKVSA